MQDILLKILDREQETDQAVWELLRTLPGYRRAQQELEKATQAIQSQVGFQACEAWESAWLACTAYEIRAYYAVGLGLRRELVRALAL